jgi:ATP-dependent RNA helicase RhlE
MISAGIQAAAIHGNKGQGARTKALAGFKNGSLTALVATDIAARGLDIPLLPHVVNFELPNIPEDYVHRIGRTGRAGANGEAISLFSPDDYFFCDIEKLIGLKIPTENIAGFEPDPKHLLNLLNKVKAEQQRIQHLDNRKRIVQTEAVIIALVQDVITTDVLTKKLSLSV